MVLINAIKAAVIRELHSKGFSMERDGDSYYLANDEHIVEVTTDNDMLIITVT